MEQKNHIYIAIDLKSFYASVECVERGLDPLSTNLVVADASRKEKTICLAVSPSLKAFGIPGRARLFEVVQKVKEVNAGRRMKAPRHSFTGESYYEAELKESSELSLDYIIAPPQMAKYMDVTQYLETANLTAREFTMKIISEVLQTIGITVTAGIGTNLYLCKIAMDIVAKHIPADKWTYVNMVDNFKATFTLYLPQLDGLHQVLNN